MNNFISAISFLSPLKAEGRKVPNLSDSEKAPRARKQDRKENWRPEYFRRLFHRIENPTMFLNIMLKWAWDEGKKMGRDRMKNMQMEKKWKLSKILWNKCGSNFLIEPHKPSQFRIPFFLLFCSACSNVMAGNRGTSKKNTMRASSSREREAIYVNYDPIIKSTGRDRNVDPSILWSFNKFIFNFNAAMSYRSLISKMFYNIVIKSNLIRNASMTSFRELETMRELSNCFEWDEIFPEGGRKLLSWSASEMVSLMCFWSRSVLMFIASGGN